MRTKIFSIKPKYLVLACLLFLIEVFIALYVRDGFIRPYLGDFLVVILLYFLLKSFWNTSSFTIAMVILIFSFGVEFAQYFDVVELLGLQHNKMARIIIGTSFHWKDLVAYVCGVICVYFIDEKWILRKKANL